jgi:hypothetical protein
MISLRLCDFAGNFCSLFEFLLPGKIIPAKSQSHKDLHEINFVLIREIRVDPRLIKSILFADKKGE